MGDQNSELTVNAEAMDWADDITYAVHDIEDFFRIGLVPLDDYKRGTKALDGFLKYATSEGAIGAITGDEKAAFIKALELFPSSRFSGTASDIVELDTLRSWLLTTFINDCSLKSDGKFHRQPETDRLNELLKQFIWYYIIDNPALANIQEGQMRVLREIFDGLEDVLLVTYGSGATTVPDDRALRRLPFGLRHAVDIAKANPGEYTLRQQLYRALIDYMASLSDAAAYRLHSTLRGEVKAGYLHTAHD